MRVGWDSHTKQSRTNPVTVLGVKKSQDNFKTALNTKSCLYLMMILHHNV